MNNQETAELAFSAFQKALNNNLISLDKCEVHKDLLVHFDQPHGQTRFTYAMMATGTRIKASCVAVQGDPYKGKLCFDVGVTTFKKFRKQGHGTSVLAKAIDELKNGLSRNGVKAFYIELKVDKDNEASHKLCRKFADEIIETEQGTNYLKLVTV
ncbi:GNAT family N-acetyltransferase [Shewanella sp. WPAGA9]|uniref:GNAT family N-acetyltransferase n=1 Tax=Shewanella sp. ENK2 TaxID=2775245 RepID=UPI00177EAE67|nr:GNAT family N-acetyltransferase [Shewanella sp. WPAGA9]